MRLLNSFCLLLFLAVGSNGVAATPNQDRAIERSARESYALKAILDDRVHVSVNAGIATLTGSAHDRDLRSLAANTLLGIPAVTGVNNQIVLQTNITEYSDAWIALKLRNRLSVQKGVDSARIEIQVINQVVRLRGSVAHQEQKELTEEYAKRTAWVRSVKNELLVVPSLSSTASPEAIDDASVSALLLYALNDDRLLQVSNIKISTLNGVVVISGFTESEEEKELVTNHASCIRGVVSVKNNLLIRNTDPTRHPQAARTS